MVSKVQYFSSHSYEGENDSDTYPYVSYWFMSLSAPQGRQNRRKTTTNLQKNCKKSDFFLQKPVIEGPEKTRYWDSGFSSAGAGKQRNPKNQLHMPLKEQLIPRPKF